MQGLHACSLLPFAAKQDRLRQAKAEAEKEIAAYRAEREGAYQKKIAEVIVKEIVSPALMKCTVCSVLKESLQLRSVI